MGADKTYQLQNIWKELSDKGLIFSTFEEWLPGFQENKQAQKNVHNLLLSDTDKYKGVSEDFNTWSKSLLGERGYTGEHISQTEWVDISSEGFGLLKKGREELMEDKLYEIYNWNRDPYGIQFEQFGAGNNIRVTLPNGDMDEFELSGAGAGAFGVETAKMKEDHVRLKQFISQQKTRELSIDVKGRFEDIFLERSSEWIGRMDNNVAKELNALGLKTEDGNYKFEAVNNLLIDGSLNAIRITTPTGAKRTVEIGGLTSGKIADQKRVMSYIINFIESDPGTYSDTEEYKSELKEIEKIIDPFLTEESLKDLLGSDILNPASKKVLIREIQEKGLGTWEGSSLKYYKYAEKHRKFRNISIDDQHKFIEQKIEEYVNVKLEGANP
jgi:hypothetical protein